MKKNNTFALSIFCLSVLFVSLIGLTGCNQKTKTNTEYTVIFDPNTGQLADGNTRDTVHVKSGEKVTEPTDPTKVGSAFAGWQKPDGTAFDFTTETITADITLTAQWILEYSLLNDLTDNASALRWWMEQTIQNAHTNPTNRYFTGGPNTGDVVSARVDGNNTYGAVFTILVATNTGSMASTQTGIPSTGGVARHLDVANLWGTNTTADSYAVSGDTLFIIQSEANAQTRTTLAIMVIDSVQKGLFVKAGQAAGMLLPSSNK